MSPVPRSSCLFSLSDDIRKEEKDVNICHCVSSDKIEHVVVPRKYFLSDILLSWIICYRTACLNMLQHAWFPMFTSNKHANISKPRPNSHPFPLVLDYSQTNKHVSRCMWRLNIPWCIWCTYTTTPTPTRCEQRDAFKNITFPQLCLRVVMRVPEIDIWCKGNESAWSQCTMLVAKIKRGQ